jgi:signal transduction histidine kinase
VTRNLEKRVTLEIAQRMKNEQLLVQQSKLAAMGEMLGAIAHQWRQPLNALGLIVQNAQEAFVHGDLDKTYMEGTVQKAMAQIHHMSKTIDDFRNFFLPDKERTIFDAMRAVGDVLSLFSAQLAANDIGYTLTCHTHGRTVENEENIVPCGEKSLEGFKNEFEHVILNLINNARDAILDRREKDQTAWAQRGSVRFDFYQTDGRTIITVSDNGGGIPEEALNRLFEPYFTTKGPSRGTGLGLYLSKVIIEDHMRGKLSARNHAQGATFTIELPLPEKEASHE